MINKNIFCLCGASGVGKSSILEAISKEYPIETIEVSARPYLPKDKDYVSSLNEQSQTLITQHRFADILNGVMNKHNPIIYSRSPIDSLAYERVLKKAPFLEELLIRQISIFRDYINYIYVPIEFKMEESTDIVRGNDVDVQKSTDKEIRNILKQYNIPYLELTGTVEEREKLLKEYLRKFYIFKLK